MLFYTLLTKLNSRGHFLEIDDYFWRWVYGENMHSFIEKIILKIKKSYLKLAVHREIESGARYEALKLPIEGLEDLKLFQLTKEETEYGVEISGLGMSLDQDQAYFLAAMEFFERESFVRNSKKHNLYSTNGIASGLDFMQANHAALSELYERDSFLRHWYSSTSFERIYPELSKYKQVLGTLERDGLEIRFYKTFLGHKVTTACFIIQREERGFVVGLSCGKGESRDSEKSLLEAIINYYFGHEGITKDRAIERIQNHGFKRLVDHRNYWLYLEAFPEWIESEKDCLTGDLLTPKIEEIYRENGVVKTVCLHSDHLIPITLGRFSDLDITVQKNYFGANLTINRATDIHPIP